LKGLPAFSLADVIVADPSLPVALETVYRFVAPGKVLGTPTLYPCAPFFPVADVHLFPHQADDIGFIKPKLQCDCLEWGTVFPGHFNNAVYFFRFEISHIGWCIDDAIPT
jgi:hypothetical protein